MLPMKVWLCTTQCCNLQSVICQFTTVRLLRYTKMFWPGSQWWKLSLETMFERHEQYSASCVHVSAVYPLYRTAPIEGCSKQTFLIEDQVILLFWTVFMDDIQHAICHEMSSILGRELNVASLANFDQPAVFRFVWHSTLYNYLKNTKLINFTLNSISL